MTDVSAWERFSEAEREALARAAGGRRLCIPGRLNAARGLVALVGYDLAVKLVLYWGDSRIYVPTLNRKTADDRTVARLTNRGRSASEIARTLGCSDRAVYAARNRNQHRKRKYAKPTLVNEDSPNG